MKWKGGAAGYGLITRYGGLRPLAHAARRVVVRCLWGRSPGWSRGRAKSCLAVRAYKDRDTAGRCFG